MTATTRKSAFLSGAANGLPFIFVIVPFGLLFGVVGTEAGLNIAQVMGFTVLVIAGASQFTAVSLMTENAPVVLILAASLAVNLRMAMYSAAMVPHLGKAALWKRALAAYVSIDQVFAASAAKFEAEPGMTAPQRIAFYLGVAVPIVPLWYAGTWVGAVLGASAPDAFAIDFALPLTFLAMLGPLLRTVPQIAAALTAALLSLALMGLPPGVGLMIAAGIGMVTGALVETWMERHP